ncbi:MAG: aminoglycoside phosphotransferase family protein [Mycobacteriales bacterium]
MAESAPADGRGGIDAELVRRLVAGQFPQWRDLPITPVRADGWDNRTYHLGDDMSVRLPCDAAHAVAKEQRWLPILAPHLPLPVPVLLGTGTPTAAYPHYWSVYRWLDGERAGADRIDDLDAFALMLAGFLTTLRGVDATGGPAPGPHNFHRGGPLALYDAGTREAIATLGDRIDGDAATEVWETALASRWDRPPVWFHGDVAVGNLLVKAGRLAAIIDFGTCGVGDPACDLAITWTFFTGPARESFRAAIDLDAATWDRGRGWTLWKALIGLAAQIDTEPDTAAESRRVLEAVLADHKRSL